VLGADEYVEVHVGPVLAGLVEQLRERGAFEQ
jgi:hypothetical protein